MYFIVDLEDHALKTLRIILKDPEANWTSSIQKEAVLLVLKGDHDLLAIMATGSGKTMLALIPALLDQDQLTVVILPLKSLIMDYERKLKAMDIGYEHFKGTTSESLTGQHNLVLVSVDVAQGSYWKKCLGQIQGIKPVGRFICDECHFALTSNDFRMSFNNMDRLRVQPAQMVLLSGTVPPSAEVAISNAFGLSTPHTTIRSSTDRPELSYHLESKVQSQQAIIQQTSTLLSTHLSGFGPLDRALVFVPFKSLGSDMATALHYSFFHGDLSDDLRRRTYQDWLEGIFKVMICTSAFGTGNDYPHIRVVIHAGTPTEMIGFVQEISRAGRDKQSATCYTIPFRISAPTLAPNDPDYKGKTAMYHWITSPGCLRNRITLYMDGPPNNKSCLELLNCQLCSSCSNPVSTSMTPVSKTSSRGVPFNSTYTPIQPLSNLVQPIKRKRAETSSAIVQAAQQVQKKLREAEQVDLEYVEVFQKALAKFVGCAYCQMHGNSGQHHSILHCSLFATRALKDDFLAWKRGFQYTLESDIRLCFKCHIPILGPLHSSDFTLVCQAQDKVIPILYGIFNNKEVKKAACLFFQVEEWTSLVEYRSWLTSKAPKETKYYTCAMFLWYCTYYI